MLVEGKLRLPIQTLCEGNMQLEEFLAERVQYYFREIRGFKYDEVNAVLVSGWDDLLDVEERLEAVRAVRPTENFEPLAASFKRIRNILKQSGFEGLGDALNAGLLESGPERELYEAFEVTRARLQGSARLPQQTRTGRHAAPQSGSVFRQNSGERPRPRRAPESPHAACIICWPNFRPSRISPKS